MQSQLLQTNPRNALRPADRDSVDNKYRLSQTEACCRQTLTITDKLAVDRRRYCELS